MWYGTYISAKISQLNLTQCCVKLRYLKSQCIPTVQFCLHSLSRDILTDKIGFNVHSLGWKCAIHCSSWLASRGWSAAQRSPCPIFISPTILPDWGVSLILFGKWHATLLLIFLNCLGRSKLPLTHPFFSDSIEAVSFFHLCLDRVYLRHHRQNWVDSQLGEARERAIGLWVCSMGWFSFALCVRIESPQHDPIPSHTPTSPVDKRSQFSHLRFQRCLGSK